MKIGLFIPCYVNQYYPKVGIATYRLLQQLGFEVDYPTSQTCCGQPLGNAGYERFTEDAERHFKETFEGFEVVVAPSASCALFAREYKKVIQYQKQEIFELSDFIVRKGLLSKVNASFPRKVGVLQSCHGLRGLNLGSSTELMEDRATTLSKVLNSVRDIQIVEAERPDDCCGFGGTFSIGEPDLSVKMGIDRIDDFIKNGAEVITGTDVSCLMHLEGIIRKRKLRLETMHFSEILMPI